MSSSAGCRVMTNADGTITWRELFDEAADRLAAVTDEPAVDARRIVEQASGFEGPEFALGLAELATNRGVAAFDSMIERRLTGEPLQYVLGRWGFRRLDLMVDRRVLIPRPETEQVVEEALGEIDRTGGSTVVDLGTGSGAIALSCALEREHCSVWAVDASTDALAVARANLAGIGRAAVRVTMLHGSWFEPLDPGLMGRVDVVVSNPPYVADSDPLPPVVADWEPRAALIPGPEGTESLVAIVDEAPRWIRAGGALVMELAPHQAEWAVDRARGAGFAAAEVRTDLAGRDRTLVARR